jgi:hypothetical protein
MMQGLLPQFLDELCQVYVVPPIVIVSPLDGSVLKVAVPVLLLLPEVAVKVATLDPLVIFNVWLAVGSPEKLALAVAAVGGLLCNVRLPTVTV